MPILVVQLLVNLERIKHYTVAWWRQVLIFAGWQGSCSVHWTDMGSVYVKAGAGDMAGTSARPEQQRPWVCSSDCCGIKSMLLLVQREEHLAKNFKETLRSGFGRKKGFHLMEIRTGGKKLLHPISSFSLGTQWRTDPGHGFFNSLYNLVLKSSKWWAGDPSLGRTFIFDQCHAAISSNFNNAALSPVCPWLSCYTLSIPKGVLQTLSRHGWTSAHQ